ncbi:MAG: SusE domain-containing protein [Muribaculaceae bacterium]|nr:SusE domain-containing protein [Muribaculaceae bacterium]
MKKIAYIFAIGTALLATTSCKQNTEPKFERAVSMELNTPPLANQLYTLTPDGTIDLTWSQPDWGFAAAATYQVEASFEEDFHYYENGTPSFYFTMPTEYHSCAASVKMSDLAVAICTLRGITDPSEYTEEPARKVYLRVHGYINGILESSVYSNVIALEQVKEYCAVRVPGSLYIIGNYLGDWIAPDPGNADKLADWRLREPEDGIDSKVYTGSVNYGPGAMFRFYSALTGWDADSWGAQKDDNPVEFTFTDGEFNGKIDGPGFKGSYSFPDWAGGTMNMTVNLNDKTFIITTN